MWGLPFFYCWMQRTTFCRSIQKLCPALNCRSSFFLFCCFNTFSASFWIQYSFLFDVVNRLQWHFLIVTLHAGNCLGECSFLLVVVVILLGIISWILLHLLINYFALVFTFNFDYSQSQLLYYFWHVIDTTLYHELGL